MMIRVGTTPGVARKLQAGEGGAVIGVALQPLASGLGKVVVLVRSESVSSGAAATTVESPTPSPQTLQDFGTSEVTGGDTWVDFSIEFSDALGASLSVVTLSADRGDLVLFVKEKSQRGFRIGASGSFPAHVDWVAAGRKAAP